MLSDSYGIGTSSRSAAALAVFVAVNAGVFPNFYVCSSFIY